MSVPAWRRDTHENGKRKDYLDVIIDSEKLLFHTITKISGNKGRLYFSKSETFTKKIPLLEVARKIYHDLRKANLLHIETSFYKRNDMQLEVEQSFLCWQSYLLQQNCYWQIMRARKFYYKQFKRRVPE